MGVWRVEHLPGLLEIRVWFEAVTPGIIHAAVNQLVGKIDFTDFGFAAQFGQPAHKGIQGYIGFPGAVLYAQAVTIDQVDAKQDTVFIDLARHNHAPQAMFFPVGIDPAAQDGIFMRFFEHCG